MAGHRRSIRLQEYDYSQAGAYFITVCAQKRMCLFGEIAGGTMILNDAGQMVLDAWQDLVQRFEGIQLDEYTVMPNHIHGIIIIRQDTASRHPLGRIIQGYKSITTNRYIHGVNTHGWPRFPARLWQRNYYERIIRDDRELANTRQYITDNPSKWPTDQENPENNFGPPYNT